MHDADELCHRIAFIVDGKIALIDSPKALKLKYGTPTGQSGIISTGRCGRRISIDGIGKRQGSCASSGKRRFRPSIPKKLPWTIFYRSYRNQASVAPRNEIPGCCPYFGVSRHFHKNSIAMQKLAIAIQWDLLRQFRYNIIYAAILVTIIYPGPAQPAGELLPGKDPRLSFLTTRRPGHVVCRLPGFLFERSENTLQVLWVTPLPHRYYVASKP